MNSPKLSMFRDKEIKKKVLIILLVYFLSQGFMLVLTGSWWDEKTWMYYSMEQIRKISIELGRPSVSYIIPFMLMLPEFARRCVIFATFLVITFEFYYILNSIDLFKDDSPFWITLLFSTLPVNDARVMWGVYPYSFGMLLFFTAFILLILLQRTGYSNVFLRILCITFFFASFILNSLLVFYFIPIMFVIWDLVKKHKLGRWYCLFDFFVAPFVFYILKQCIYPVSGVYSDYNIVTINNLLHSIILNVDICKYVVERFIVIWKDYLAISVCVSFSVVLLAWIINREKRQVFVNRTKIDIKNNVIMLGVGCCVMYLSTLPYTVIGQGQSLTGVTGRGSILVGIGASIILVSLISYVSNIYIRGLLYIIFIVCGICHFNRQYALYQHDYYRQLDIIYEMKENEENLYAKDNLLFITYDDPEINATRFYTLNALGKEAFGNECRFVMFAKRKDYELLYDTEKLKNFVANSGYLMSEYDLYSSRCIDAIIVYNYSFIYYDTMKLKLIELFNAREFENALYDNQNMQVIMPNSNEYSNYIKELNLDRLCVQREGINCCE